MDWKSWYTGGMLPCKLNNEFQSTAAKALGSIYVLNKYEFYNQIPSHWAPSTRLTAHKNVHMHRRQYGEDCTLTPAEINI